jgi:hypothetical protein
MLDETTARDVQLDIADLLSMRSDCSVEECYEKRSSGTDFSCCRIRLGRHQEQE